MQCVPFQSIPFRFILIHWIPLLSISSHSILLSSRIPVFPLHQRSVSSCEKNLQFATLSIALETNWTEQRGILKSLAWPSTRLAAPFYMYLSECRSLSFRPPARTLFSLAVRQLFLYFFSLSLRIRLCFFGCFYLCLLIIISARHRCISPRSCIPFRTSLYVSVFLRADISQIANYILRYFRRKTDRCAAEINPRPSTEFPDTNKRTNDR